jgi:hypothetical protein
MQIPCTLYIVKVRHVLSPERATHINGRYTVSLVKASSNNQLNKNKSLQHVSLAVMVRTSEQAFIVVDQNRVNKLVTNYESVIPSVTFLRQTRAPKPCCALHYNFSHLYLRQDICFRFSYLFVEFLFCFQT